MRVRRVLIAVGCVLLIEGFILFWLSFVKAGVPVTGKDGNTQQEKTADVMKGGEGSKAAEVNSEKAYKIYKKNPKNLVLVNKERELDINYNASLRTICNGRLQASERLYGALVRMLHDAGEEGYHFWIASAWRSREKQQKLVDEDVRKEMQKGASYEEALEETLKETMEPGHSEHETGLALDILCSGNMKMDSTQGREPGNIWLRKNCHRYGFIFRYPKDKEKITGIRYEPWHFRYVGEKASKYMKKYNLTLEEFWELI